MEDAAGFIEKIRKANGFIGKICKINGTEIYVDIPDISSTQTVQIQGRTYRIGQTNSFVSIIQKHVELIGIVNETGYQDFDHNGKFDTNQAFGIIQLIGEIDSNGNFSAGLSTFPILGDEVYVATYEKLKVIFESFTENAIQIGKHAALQELPACINVNRLVTRHSLIVGSSGSGKSNCTAVIIDELTKAYPGAQIIVIDPHGEYASAFPDQSTVFSIGSEKNPLYLPFWALTFDELAWFLVGRQSAVESQQDKILRDKIVEEKRRFYASAQFNIVNAPVLFSADTPIYFDLKKVWYDLYHQEYATFWERENWKKIAYKIGMGGIICSGNAAQLSPPQFEPPANDGNPPYASKFNCNLSVYINKILMRLKDSRYDFLLQPGPYDGVNKDLNDLLESWVGHSKPITVFDLEGVPFEVMDLVIGVLTKLLYQMMVSGKDLPGIGRQRPLLLVYEEAHSYLSHKNLNQFVAGYARMSGHRILKEGRKYGMGAMIVSQRPSEIDPTMIAQVGTMIALRLTNVEDHTLVESILPNNLSGLVRLLSGLKTGEAILSGEAVPIPSRVHLPVHEPRPHSSDTEPTREWKERSSVKESLHKAVQTWRGFIMPDFKKPNKAA